MSWRRHALDLNAAMRSKILGHTLVAVKRGSKSVSPQCSQEKGLLSKGVSTLSKEP